MKILMVGLATFDEMAGGSARYLSGLSKALADSGHEVLVLTGAGIVGAAGFSEQGIRGQVRRSLMRFLVVVPRTALAVARGRPDVVNVHFVLDGIGAVLAARLLGIPVILNFQGPWAAEAIATGHRGAIPGSTALRRAIERWTYRAASRIIVLSSAFSDLLVEHYQTPPEKIRVLPAGIDLQAVGPLMDRSVARARLDLPEGRTIVTVRRLVARMGLDILLTSVARLDPANRPLVVITGIGPERNALIALAEALGISDRVRFLGRVPDAELSAVYAAGDLCVVPTRELEGFGYVALEAYAAGTPVIATAVGGLVDLVGGFDPTSLTAPRADALASRIATFFDGESPDREACRRYAEAFDWVHIAPRVVSVFAESRA